MTETITTATARVVEQLTREAVAPREIEPGLYLAADAETGSRVIDVRDQIQRTKDHPLRKTGAVTLTQHDSFTAYLAKHALPDTEMWADIDKDRVVAVINAHGGSADRTTTAPATPTQMPPTTASTSRAHGRTPVCSTGPLTSWRRAGFDRRRGMT